MKFFLDDVSLDNIKSMINNETLVNLIDDVIDLANMSTDQIVYSVKVAWWCRKLLEHRGLITDNVHQGFVDVILFGALIHNAYVNQFDSNYHIYDVFKARENLDSLFEERGIPSDYRNSIFQLIESQFGPTFEIPYARPQADSPQSILATAKFIVDTLISIDE